MYIDVYLNLESKICINLSGPLSLLFQILNMCRFRGVTEGPEPPPPPPLGFVRGGVLCRCLMGRRGDPKVVLSYYHQFFGLASLASLYVKRVNVWKILITSKVKGQGTVIPSQKPSFIFNLRFLDFMKVHFHCWFDKNYTILHHLNQNFLGQDPPPPISRTHFTLRSKIICQNIFLFGENTRRSHIYEIYCLESRFNG